jgi:hypothetical protein
MAEVYWDLEWTLQQRFDYTYDKKLYDQLQDGHAGPWGSRIPRRASQ